MIKPSQINLFNAEFSHPQHEFSFSRLAKLLMLWIGLLVLTGLGLSLWKHSVETNFNKVTQKRDEVQATLTQLNQQLMTRHKDNALIEQLKVQQDRLDLRQQMKNWLSQGGIPQTKGFSSYLRTLAEHPDPAVRLTRFEFAGDGRALRIEGETFTANAVPQYFQKLSETKTFKGQRFTDFVLSRPAKVTTKEGGNDPLPLIFVLSTDSKKATLKNDGKP